MSVTWLSESYEHGPDDVERLAAVVAALAAAPPRNMLVVSTAEDSTSAAAMRPTQNYLERVHARHRAAWGPVLAAAVRFCEDTPAPGAGAPHAA